MCIAKWMLIPDSWSPVLLKRPRTHCYAAEQFGWMTIQKLLNLCVWNILYGYNNTPHKILFLVVFAWKSVINRVYFVELQWALHADIWYPPLWHGSGVQQHATGSTSKGALHGSVKFHPKYISEIRNETICMPILLLLSCFHQWCRYLLLIMVYDLTVSNK